MSDRLVCLTHAPQSLTHSHLASSPTLMIPAVLAESNQFPAVVEAFREVPSDNMDPRDQRSDRPHPSQLASLLRGRQPAAIIFQPQRPVPATLMFVKGQS